MSSPYRNQHAECCNASFAYWEYLPTCRSCSRELCGEASCVVAGSEQERSDGRKTYICKEPACAEGEPDDAQDLRTPTEDETLCLTRRPE